MQGAGAGQEEQVAMVDFKIEDDLSEAEEKLFRRCFDNVDDLCGQDLVDGNADESEIDRRRDGRISVMKLKKLISRLEDSENILYMGPCVQQMDQKAKRNLVKETLNEIDTNNDGCISYEEYKIFVGKMKRVGRGQTLATYESRYEQRK
jgi:hypothetical protein